MSLCKQHPLCELMHRKGGHVKLAGIYRVLHGKREGMGVWIVDRNAVVLNLYPEFIMGGNDQRYRFNPFNEVWIDSNSGVEEFQYTLAHELIERRLMQDKGWSYDRAHTEGGLATEKRLRDRNEVLVQRKKLQVKQLAPRLGTSSGSCGRLAHPVAIASMYRQYWGAAQGVKVWIIDGPKVRHELNPDFCYGTHDLTSPFVPSNEIWLDSAMSVLEVHFTLKRQLLERKLIAQGADASVAYESALIVELEERQRQVKLIARHEAALPPVSYGVRDRGVKPKRKK